MSKLGPPFASEAGRTPRALECTVDEGGSVPRPPPSLPCPAGAWEYWAGCISAGSDIAGYQNVLMTPAAAEQTCQRLPSCLGYTYTGSGDAATPTQVWLKDKWDCGKANGWHAYKKPGGPSRPPL